MDVFQFRDVVKVRGFAIQSASVCINFGTLDL